MDTIGKRIRHARKTAGLTQKAAARHVGVDQSTLSDWESDRGPGPRLIEGMRFCTLVGCGLDWLVLGRGKAPQEAEAA